MATGRLGSEQPGPARRSRRAGGVQSPHATPTSRPGRLRPARRPAAGGLLLGRLLQLRKSVLEAKGLHPRVTMQVFQKTDGAVLGGMDEALAMLRLCSGRFEGEGADRAGWPAGTSSTCTRSTTATSSRPGRRCSPSRATTACSPTSRPCISARSRGARSSAPTCAASWTPRGASRSCSSRRASTTTGCRPATGTPPTSPGPIGVSTDAQASWWGGKGIGTVPHGLIAACGGDTVEAAAAFADVYYPEINVTALVDFDNDCVATSLACARALGERLWGVRLDTGETMVDRSLWHEMGQFRPNGVAPELVREVRRALDAEGFQHVKIVVSGGFDAERIPPSRRRACRPTPTAWAAACCAASPTSRPTSCCSRAGPAPRSGAPTGPTRASQRVTEARPGYPRYGQSDTASRRRGRPAPPGDHRRRHAQRLLPSRQPGQRRARLRDAGSPPPSRARRGRGRDLVFLVDTHAPDDPEFAMFPPHCVEGSGEDEVVPELAGFAARGTVVRKHTFSGFYGTPWTPSSSGWRRRSWRWPECAPTSACCTRSPVCACGLRSGRAPRTGGDLRRPGPRRGRSSTASLWRTCATCSARGSSAAAAAASARS